MQISLHQYSNMVIQFSCKTKKDAKRMKRCVLNKTSAESFIHETKIANKDLDLEEPTFYHDLLGKLETISEAEEGEEGFFLKVMIEVMDQVTEPIEVFKLNKLLRKRNRKCDRGQDICHRCGQIWQFAHEKPSCFLEMKKKIQAFRKRKDE